MADDQVVTNIVAKADFSDLIANVHKVTASLAAMQQQMGASNKVISSQINALNRSFGETLRSTGQFSTHFVSLANDVETFGKRLDGGKLKLRDYFSTLQTHTRTTGGLIRDLARQQVQLQNAIVQPLGRNAQGLMQFNVHIPQGLDAIKNKGAIARQEMQILNKVMQEGAGQLINWGKNTQWAGRQLTVGLTVPIAAFGVAAAKAFREADAELVRLTKVYGGIAATSSAELGKIRADVAKTAADLSKAYGASYKDTIALAADIAATGKQGNDLLRSTQETTRLSILGEVDRQDAMKTTLALQSAFKQNTTELAESINFLNSVENQTSTTLQDLTEAIPKAGPVIKGLGGDVQDLALFLVAMKEGGINATEGANALKSALASIINPTKVAKGMFKDMGISLEGIVNGNAGDVKGMIFELQAALDKLDPLKKQQAIEQLFGKFQFARMSALFENLGKQGSQTLQVMDLMKASSADLAKIADRELKQVTESASGKYRRAVEGLKADLAGIGEEFLKIQTFFVNLVDGIVKFINKLPAPVKTILTFLAGLTAVTGPLIMLTGVLANFLGYVIKGAFHLKALFKGGEGWKLLTPDILAAQQAGNLIEKTFYSDAKAALALADALQILSAGMTSIQSKMAQGVVSVQPMLSTVAGSIIVPPGDGGGGGGGGIARVVDPRNPLVGPAGTRASAHMVPRSGMSQEERAAQTIHSFLPAPIPVNQAIGANPQIFAAGDLPAVPGLTTITGKAGPVSTGVVASEAAKWHTMVGTLSMMTKQEVAQMKTQISTTGVVSSEFTQAFGALLPQMTAIAENAAQQSAVIVAEAKAGTISVETARQRIIQLNLQVEQLMAQATMGTATSLGRTAVITGVPTLDQPVVDPKTGKSNMRELFKKGKTRSFVDDLARLMGVRTWGAGYSTHTTIPIRRNAGGPVYLSGGSQTPIVPGPSVDKDVVPALLTPGEFVVNRRATAANLPLLQAINGRGSRGPAYNDGSEKSITGGVDLTLEEMRRIDPKFRGSKPGYRAKGGSGTYGGPISDPALLAKYPYLVDPATGTITIEKINAALSSPTMGGALPGPVMLASIEARGGGPRSSSEQFLQSLAKSGIISSAEASAISDEIHSRYASRISLPTTRLTDNNNDFWRLSDRIIQRRLSGNADAIAVWSDFSRSLTHHTSHGRRSTTARSIRLTSPSGTEVRVGKLQGKGSTSFLHSRMPSPFIDRLVRAGFFTDQVVRRAFLRRNSGGMVPGYNAGDIVARGYNDSIFPVGPTTGTPITAAQWSQALGQPTLYSQMVESGELRSPAGSPVSAAPQPTQIPRGAKFGMGAANIGGNILGFTAGSALGGKLSGGNQLVSMIAGLVTSQIVASGLTKLVAGMTGLGNAAGGSAGKTNLLTKAFRMFIGLPGPLKLLAVVVGVGAAIKGINDKIEEHRRIVTTGFGVTEDSAKKLGLSYKKLGSEIDEYQKKYDLMLAKAKSNRYRSTKAEGQGIDITVPELDKLKKEVAKNFPDEIKMFNKATQQEAIERATNLKAAMVAMGKSVQEANETIYAMLLNSNKATYALDILGDKGFGNIKGKISATNSTVKTFGNIIKQGNFDQLPIALTTAVNALDNLQISFTKTDKKTKEVVSSSEAYEKVLKQIMAASGANAQIGEKGLEEILAQNEGLRDVINSTDTLASVWAKIKLSTSGINFDLKDMSAETATTISILLEKQRDYLLTSNSSIKAAANTISQVGNITREQVVKNAAKTKEALEAEIKLREKNIKRIQEQADARKKALDEELASEDFLAQIKKKQLEYSEALSSGDLAKAAQAQIDIQSMTGSRQVELAKQAIDTKAEADIRKQEAIIEKLSQAIDNLAKSTENSIKAAEAGIAEKGNRQSLLDDFMRAVGLAAGGVTPNEKILIDEISKTLKNSGIQEFIDLAQKYLTLAPSGNYVGSMQPMGYGSLESLQNAAFTVVAGNLRVEDVELKKAIEALKTGKTPTSTTQFTPRSQQEKSGMGTKTVLTITPQQYVDSGMYVEGENPIGKQFLDYLGRKFKITAKQEDGDYVVTRVYAMGGQVKNYMPGGKVSGPGTGTSDSIPAMLSNGEYVIKADSVKKYGKDTFDALNAQRFAGGGYANPSSLITPSVPYYMKEGGQATKKWYAGLQALTKKENWGIGTKKHGVVDLPYDLYKNVLFPTALWADRLTGLAPDGGPIASTNKKQIAAWEAKAEKEGLASVLPSMLGQQALDIAALLPWGKIGSKIANIGFSKEMVAQMTANKAAEKIATAAALKEAEIGIKYNLPKLWKTPKVAEAIPESTYVPPTIPYSPPRPTGPGAPPPPAAAAAETFVPNVPLSVRMHTALGERGLIGKGLSSAIFGLQSPFYSIKRIASSMAYPLRMAYKYGKLDPSTPFTTEQKIGYGIANPFLKIADELGQTFRPARIKDSKAALNNNPNELPLFHQLMTMGTSWSGGSYKNMFKSIREVLAFKPQAQMDYLKQLYRILKEKAYQSKKKIANLPMTMDNPLYNYLYSNTPLGGLIARREAKKLGFQKTQKVGESGLDLPLEQLLKNFFYHGGDIAKLQDRFPVPLQGYGTPNWFGYDFFSTIGLPQAHNYAITKNARGIPENASDIFRMLFNLDKSKTWDMRPGFASLWSQNKTAFRVLESALIAKHGVAEARRMLLGERIPGTAWSDIIPGSSGTSAPGFGRGTEGKTTFTQFNLGELFGTMIGGNPQRVIDTIIHKGGVGSLDRSPHTVIGTMAPSRTVKEFTKIFPRDLIASTLGIPDEDIPSLMERMLEQYTKMGKAFSVLGQGHLANGGYINIPKFEKGINMVPANMLAMLHKNEAVVPANMNPFNPNAQSYSQPSVSYNIAPVINAAPGMDEQAIANMATRQVLAEIKALDARNNAAMGRPGMRVVGK